MSEKPLLGKTLVGVDAPVCFSNSEDDDPKDVFADREILDGRVLLL